MDTMYSDSPEQPQAQQPEASPEQAEEKGEEKTALIPKTLLAGKEFKPGEEVVFKIVRLHDDDVEIAYATGEEKGEKPGAPPEQPGAGAPQGDSEMSGMMY